MRSDRLLTVLAPPHRRYRDRYDAGRRLSRHLVEYRSDQNVVVLAIPRGGVPVGFEVAHALDVPFDVVVVRKLGHPSAPELAIGALAEEGVRVLNPEVEVPPEAVEAIIRRESSELARRVRKYRAGHPPVDLRGRTVILVDDGLATGSTMRAAVAACRSRGALPIVVAVPVGAPSTCLAIAMVCDRVVCPLQPSELWGVGEWYENFGQTSDEEVISLLERARRAAALAAS